MGIQEDINQKKFDSSHQKAVINLIYTGNWLRDQFSEARKKFGITQQQYNVLRILRGQHPKACSAKVVKGVMLDKSPDLTRLVDKLVELKLVSRETCPTNRRQIDLLITKKGLAKLKEMDPANKASQKSVEENLTEAEAEQLSTLLDKLRGSKSK